MQILYRNHPRVTHIRQIFKINVRNSGTCLETEIMSLSAEEYLELPFIQTSPTATYMPFVWCHPVCVYLHLLGWVDELWMFTTTNHRHEIHAEWKSKWGVTRLRGMFWGLQSGGRTTHSVTTHPPSSIHPLDYMNTIKLCNQCSRAIMPLLSVQGMPLSNSHLIILVQWWWWQIRCFT